MKFCDILWYFMIGSFLYLVKSKFNGFLGKKNEFHWSSREDERWEKMSESDADLNEINYCLLCAEKEDEDEEEKKTPNHLLAFKKVNQFHLSKYTLKALLNS